MTPVGESATAGATVLITGATAFVTLLVTGATVFATCVAVFVTGA